MSGVGFIWCSVKTLARELARELTQSLIAQLWAGAVVALFSNVLVIIFEWGFCAAVFAPPCCRWRAIWTNGDGVATTLLSTFVAGHFRSRRSRPRRWCRSPGHHRMWEPTCRRQYRRGTPGGSPRRSGSSTAVRTVVSADAAAT